MDSTDSLIARIVAFLEDIGIPAIAGEVPEDALLPGVTVCGGALVFDPQLLAWPGDLLHEAGHIAVSDPATRAAQAEVSTDPGEELAAMAWSYAAAVALEIDTALVFHDGGYRGGGGNYLESYRNGGPGIGVPMLQFYGMSAEPRQAETLDRAAFPAMARWLR